MAISLYLNTVTINLFPNNKKQIYLSKCKIKLKILFFRKKEFLSTILSQNLKNFENII